MHSKPFSVVRSATHLVLEVNRTEYISTSGGQGGNVRLAIIEPASELSC
jgi:hypothetical protein